MLEHNNTNFNAIIFYSRQIKIKIWRFLRLDDEKLDDYSCNLKLCF
jgi:hypothetical protein